MIQEILELTKGNLLKMGLATVGILSIIFHILPKGEKKAGFFGGIFNMLLGAQPAGASEMSGILDVEEGQRDKKKVLASNLGSLAVIPSGHPETGTGWGIKGVTDAHGRPVVLSQPAATAFM